MSNNWSRIEIAKLIEERALFIGDGYRAKNSELSSNGLPFARAGDISSGFHFDGADCFPEKDLQRVGNKVSNPGDVVFTSKGTVGRFAFVRANTPRFVYSPQLCFWRTLNEEKIDSRWLYYWMQSREFFAQYKSVCGQTDMAEYVSLGDQRRMSLTLPPISVQRNIAHVLGALDDKIELNVRQNLTLQRMAVSVFKDWFMDFGPVHDKINGLPTTDLNLKYIDLFPNTMANSNLPIGWSICNLAKLTSKIGSGTTPRGGKDVYVKEGVNLIRSQNVHDHQFLWNGLVKMSEEESERMRSVTVERNDILMNITGDSILRTCVVDSSVLPARVNQHVLIIRAAKGIPPRYLHLYLVHPSTKAQLLGNDAGGSRAAVTKGHLEALPILLPSAAVLLAFENLTTPWFDSIANNSHENRTLASLRNVLLPKLLSGEVCIKKAERIIEAVL